MSRPVYRGQPKASWELHSGAVQRLKELHGECILDEESKLRQLVSGYHRDLIYQMEILDGQRMSELERLSVLQHQGGATGLLDFTESPLVALWFACNEEPKEDGKVFLLDIGNPEVATDGRSLKDEDLFTNVLAVYYEPSRLLGPRIVAQQSVFVICNPPQLRDWHIRTCVIPKDLKKHMKAFLRQLGLSERVLFRDIAGLAQANTRSTPLPRKHTVAPDKGYRQAVAPDKGYRQAVAPDKGYRQAVASDKGYRQAVAPERFRDRGNRAFQKARYDYALEQYRSYAKACPDMAQPHSLVGDTLSALGRFEEAIDAYTRAIERIDQPLDLGKGVIADPETVGRYMLHNLYYNRGNSHAAIGDHCQAVDEYDSALKHGTELRRNVLLNRGNSKYGLEHFREAFSDFEAAWSERKGSDTALAMGNCKVMLGEFKDGLQRYQDGIGVGEPEGSAAHCRKNAEQTQQLLEALGNLDHQVRPIGRMVYVDAACEAATFSFAGNRGNVGNTPSGMVTAYGGKGYEGSAGFAVVIKPI